MVDRTLPHLVIVGGGFAGLYLAKGLRSARVRITMIDRHNHHLFQPMLYQVASAALNPSDIAAPIRVVLRKSTNTEVMLGEVTGIDTPAKTITTADGDTLHWDYLALAPGARHSYFGHPEWEVLAPGLKNLDDALEVRRRVLLAFERAERQEDPRLRQQMLTFVVIGGGPTGVEVAGALAEIRRFALARDFRHIDPKEATVVLLEGGARILPSYPETLSAKAKTVLRGLGVEVRENTMVTAISPTAVEASGWRIPTTTVVWAAGNAASPLLRELQVPLTRQGRVEVLPDLTVADHPDVFVLGDAALHRDANGRETPATCPAAIQMGNYAARNIRDRVEGRRPRPFRFLDKGQLAVIGRGKAVADFGRIRINGAFAWMIWALVHIAYLIGFRNRVLVMLQWGWSYLTYARGARLITGATGEYAARVAGQAR